MSKSVRQIIIAAYAKELEELAVWDELCEILRGWEGKQLTRRLFHYVEKKYKEKYADTQKMPTLYYTDGKLVMWGGFTGVDYDHKYYFYLPTGSVFTHFEFGKANPSYYVGAQERQNKREMLLNSDFPEKVEQLSNEYEQVMNSLRELMVDWTVVPDYFDIEKEKGIKL